MPEDSSQNTALSPEDSSLVTDTHVTAAADAADNATLTPTTEQTAAPQQVVEQPGSTGEGVDDNSGTKTYAERLREYREAKNALLSGAPPAAAAPAAPAQAPAQAQPAPALQTAAPPPLTGGPADEGDEFPSAPTDGRMPKIKLQAVTPVDVQAMAEFKAHQRAGGKQSFVDFINTRFPAAPATGAPAVGTENTGTSSNTPATDEPQTVAEVEALLAQKKADRRAARQQFDFDAEAAIEDEEEALRAKRDVLIQSEREGQSAALQAWEAQETEYLTKVGAMFPQAKNATDPLVLKANAIQNEWWNAGDPRAQHPSRALYSYVEAAAELGIAPTATSAAPLKTTSTPSPVHRAPITSIVASGNATQTQTRVQEDTRPYKERLAAFLAEKPPQGQQRVA